MTSPISNYSTSNSTSSVSPTNSSSLAQSPYRIALITIYTVVLVVGSVGLILMISVLKANLRSWTTISFLNLLLAHLIFLITVPFRIYYYVTNYWNLTSTFCKIISAMIHIHMHVVFVIYVVILTICFLQYFKKMERMEFYRRLHALAASIGIWSVLIIIGPIILSQYGKNQYNEHECFKFGAEVSKGVPFGFNIFLSVLIILVSCILSCVLGFILHSMIKKYGSNLRNQQQFWAQMKSVKLCLIIFTCLVPYHLFRLYYLKNSSKLQDANEVFLAITTLTCFDMLLTFAGKGLCKVCGF